MKNKTIPLIINIICLLFFCSCSNTEKTKQTIVSLRQEWFPYSGYAGEVYAANETDSLNNLEIKIEAGSDNIDPIKLVSSGQSDFGVVSADRIISANEKGAELIVIGVINYISPTCFIIKKPSQLNSLRDFDNKKIGVLSGTNTEYIYKLLKKKGDFKNVKEVEIPFDLSTFIINEYDIRPGFIYDEPVSLDMQNIKYSIFKPSDFGVNFIGTVYFTRKEMIEKKPDVVQAFVNSIAKGWELALKNPNKAIKYLKVFDKNINEKRELLSLEKGVPFFEGEKKKVLYSEKNRWLEMIKNLQSLNVIGDIKDISFIDNRFISKYHETNGKK